MKADKLRNLWRNGHAAINAWLTIPSSWTVEIVARAGFDAVTIDLQHGLAASRDCLPMLQAIDATDAVPLARVPWNEPDEIMRVLDAGTQGIICPMVNSREEAEAFVGACRYPPLGFRSYGPIRAGLCTDRDYFARANAAIIALAMIETEHALDHLGSILETPGLDGVYVGSIDLGISMGVDDPVRAEDPALREAIDTILREARGRDRVAGIHTADPAQARERIRQGFALVTPMNDSTLLRNSVAPIAHSSRPECRSAPEPRNVS